MGRDRHRPVALSQAIANRRPARAGDEVGGARSLGDSVRYFAGAAGASVREGQEQSRWSSPATHTVRFRKDRDERKMVLERMADTISRDIWLESAVVQEWLEEGRVEGAAVTAKIMLTKFLAFKFPNLEIPAALAPSAMPVRFIFSSTRPLSP